MYDQSFSQRTLERLIHRGDFSGIPAASHAAHATSLVSGALQSAFTNFAFPVNPLTSFKLHKKDVYKFRLPHDELVVRKLCDNLRRHAITPNRGRAAITRNLHLLLQEGVPYRVYRLDVKAFYESFSSAAVLAEVEGLPDLSPMSKELIRVLLLNHQTMGGSGIPRGLSISAMLADLAMKGFDAAVSSNEQVYFYSRYVDDIIVVTSSRESPTDFVELVEAALPHGLALNPIKKGIVQASKPVNPVETAPEPCVLKFDYLGYGFLVHEPVKTGKQKGDHARKTIVEISASKVRKIKTRIIRSLLGYKRDHDWDLLVDRMKFLTQNFSVRQKVGGSKLAGIFHSYPEVSSEASSLAELDHFLRNAVLSRPGAASHSTYVALTSKQRNALLAQSFRRGHEQRLFSHFSASRIAEIQKCWSY